MVSNTGSGSVTCKSSLRKLGPLVIVPLMRLWLLKLRSALIDPGSGAEFKSASAEDQS
jgi:hypothetical protein